MTRAALYARYSSDNQSEGLSKISSGSAGNMRGGRGGRLSLL
jgi:hypothetical protein